MNTLDCGEVSCEYCSKDKCVHMTTAKIGVLLDKIRAEIEEQKKERCFDDADMFAYRTGLDDAIWIIDKYRTGSEVSDESVD